VLKFAGVKSKILFPAEILPLKTSATLTPSKLNTSTETLFLSSSDKIETTALSVIGFG